MIVAAASHSSIFVRFYMSIITGNIAYASKVLCAVGDTSAKLRTMLGAAV